MMLGKTMHILFRSHRTELFSWCCGLEKIDFRQLPLWDGVVVLKGMILDNFCFGRVC